MGSYIYGAPKNLGSWNHVASIFAAHDSVHSDETSSLPLVQFWQPKRDRKLKKEAQELLAKCGLNPCDFADATFCFEYPVPVGKGRGKASMTDLMIVTAGKAIAVEAKWTECAVPYQTITDWFKDRLRKGAKQENLDGVLRGWIQYINDYLKKKGFGKKAVTVNDGDYTTIPYQLLHRIASACDVSAEKEEMEAAVIYQLFYSDENSSNDEGWVVVTKEEVEKFAKKLRTGFETLFKGFMEPVPIQFCIMKTKVAKGKYFDTAMRKCKKDGDLNALFLAMQKSPIYAFSDIELIPLDPK